MAKLTINDKEIEIDNNATVMDACKKAGIEVPHFCHHPKLSIAGNCRMCLVEIQRYPKPIASCAQPVAEGMVVTTNSPMVENARKGVLELLLLNHPLDCPVCDQGGECDLQDLTMKHGPGTSQNIFPRRLVSEKNMGPLVGTVMTRCIHCTKCVRFMNEVAGSPEIGAFSRGEDMEISTYLEMNLDSELSGNIIDLCPVGALTSLPFKFQARSWEMEHINSIDISDAVGSNTRLDVRGVNVMRVLPRSNDAINEDWISDKARFSYDGLKTQRLDKPFIKENNTFQEASWDEALECIQEKISSVKGTEVAALSGDLVDCESTLLFKELMNGIGSPHTDCRLNNTPFTSSHRKSYLFNTTIAGIEAADCILLIGTNPRTEAPLINARIYKRYLKGGLTVARIGIDEKLNYPIQQLSNNAHLLQDIVNGKHEFSKTWKTAKKPMLIIGESALNRRDSLTIMHTAQQLCKQINAHSEDWNGYNILHAHASAVGSLDVGFIPGDGGLNATQILDATQKNKIKVVFLHGVDCFDRQNFGENIFIIYIGHHGDRGAHAADIILPSTAYNEKTALYVNTEGRVQQVNQATPPVGLAKTDWKIMKLIADKLGVTLPYNNRQDILRKLYKVNAAFKQIGRLTKNALQEIELLTPETFSNKPFEPLIKNFYMTDVISRNSAIMAECTNAKKDRKSA
ncbi:MAG: NADH-quinone oxidoreductase subunit G [Alphaproteobacteria bacterium CG_4_10_14_0_8_um_filter_37_21]|nr:MAG: NADH-quinone oxidoreductase subunit G [Alphaproteobacteria bacterium CG_4_10_14_0_8_um_filter_37_21]